MSYDAFAVVPFSSLQMNTYTQDPAAESERLLERSKAIVERISGKYKFSDQQKPLEESAPTLARYTRWAVTGPILANMVQAQPISNMNVPQLRDHMNHMTVPQLETSSILQNIGASRTMSSWEITKQSMFGVSPEAPIAPLARSAPPGASAGTFEAIGSVPGEDDMPAPGEKWVVIEPAKVRRGIELSSEDMGDLQEGEVLVVREAQRSSTGQTRCQLEFNDAGTLGWTSLRNGAGTPLLRRLPGDVELVDRGTICMVEGQQAKVRADFWLESKFLGYVAQHDVFEVHDVRVNSMDQVRVSLEMEDGVYGWTSMATVDKRPLLYALPPDWEDHMDQLDPNIAANLDMEQDMSRVDALFTEGGHEIQEVHPQQIRGPTGAPPQHQPHQMPWSHQQQQQQHQHQHQHQQHQHQHQQQQQHQQQHQQSDDSNDPFVQFGQTQVSVPG
jgi:hypothetical protein